MSTSGISVGSVVRFAAFTLALLAVALLASFAASDAGKAQRASKPEVDPELRSQVKKLGGGQAVAIVTYDGSPTRAEKGAVRQTGVAMHGFDELPMLAVRGNKAQLKRVLSLRGPVSIWSDRQLDYYLHESRPLIGADRVETELGYDGEGVGVAVIDSGVDGTHPDVSFDKPDDPNDDDENNELVQNVKILGDGFFTGTTVTAENVENTDTTSGHGTHVSGTVGGSGEASDGYHTGVAPGADLVGIGAGDALFILYALEGFDYAISHQDEYNIKVINNSWGTSGDFEENDPVNVASREAHDRGITVAFAAGNEGPGNDTMNPYAVAPWVIGVAAGEKDGQTLADFSSRGRPGSNLYHPDLTAPGVDIVSARALTSTFPPETSQPRYTTLSGTSMATPHVAGTAALMLDADPSLTPDRILNTLTTTVDPMPGYGRHEVGAGYLNAFDAVSAVAP